MRKTETIDLATPLKGPNDLIVKQVILREPTFDEYLEYGDPYTVAQSAGGTPFAVENAEVIRQYINLCLVEPKDPSLLKQGNAKLGRDVKNKLLGFFQPDEADSEDLKNSQMKSPLAASGETTSDQSKG